MKRLLFLLILFISFNAYSQEFPQNIDGRWVGEVTMSDGVISYDLELDVQTQDDGSLVATAKTQYSRLAVRKISLEATDVHSPLWLTAEFIEVIKDPDFEKASNYFRIILNADVIEENVLSGRAEQTFNDQPEAGRASGTFFLRRVNPKKWY